MSKISDDELEKLAYEWHAKNNCRNCKENALNAFEAGYRAAEQTTSVTWPSEDEIAKAASDYSREYSDAMGDAEAFSAFKRGVNWIKARVTK